MIDRNFLREKIAAEQPVVGSFSTLGSPLVTEVLAHGGLDFVIIDLEHGPFDLAGIHDHVSRCERYGASPVVRLPEFRDWMVLQALDQGAHGVIVPHAESREMVEQFAESARYFPSGKRGFSPFTKAGGFTNRQAQLYAEHANDFCLTGVIVESMEGVRNLDALLTISNLNIVYFGSYDLSQSIGAPGEIRHPDVVRVIEEGARKVLAAGKCPGGFLAESREDVRWLLSLGLRFITYGVDSGMLSRTVEDLVGSFRAEALASVSPGQRR